MSSFRLPSYICILTCSKLSCYIWLNVAQPNHWSWPALHIRRQWIAMVSPVHLAIHSSDGGEVWTLELVFCPTHLQHLPQRLCARVLRQLRSEWRSPSSANFFDDVWNQRGKANIKRHRWYRFILSQFQVMEFFSHVSYINYWIVWSTGEKTDTINLVYPLITIFYTTTTLPARAV